MTGQTFIIILSLPIWMIANVQGGGSPAKKAAESSMTKPDLSTGKAKTQSSLFMPRPQSTFGMFAPSFMFSSTRPVQSGLLNSSKTEPKTSLNDLVWNFSSGSDDTKETSFVQMQTEFNKDQKSRDLIQKMLREKSTATSRFTKPSFSALRSNDSTVSNMQKPDLQFDQLFLI